MMVLFEKCEFLSIYRHFPNDLCANDSLPLPKKQITGMVM